MSEESNYYTPELSEFHAGFEYQNQGDDKEWYWSNISPDLDLISRLIKDNRCRVKYLDREDIESLGFEFLPKKSLGNLTLRFEIRKLIKRIDRTEGGDDTMWWNVYLKLYPDRRRVFIKGDISDGSENERFFEGEIKNKSELKKLLEQLGIAK